MYSMDLLAKVQCVLPVPRLTIGSVGAKGFEPSTSPSRTVRANRAAPRPECVEGDYNAESGLKICLWYNFFPYYFI
jgi:hypothetical protein